MIGLSLTKQVIFIHFKWARLFFSYVSVPWGFIVCSVLFYRFVVIDSLFACRHVVSGRWSCMNRKHTLYYLLSPQVSVNAIYSCKNKVSQWLVIFPSCPFWGVIFKLFWESCLAHFIKTSPLLFLSESSCTKSWVLWNSGTLCVRFLWADMAVCETLKQRQIKAEKLSPKAHYKATGPFVCCC